MSKIIVVDDDEQIRQLFRHILQNEGHQVFTAADGADGIKLYRKEQPDLMLLDIIMPNREGIEVIREIINEHKDAKIIAISGGGRGNVKDYLNFAMHFGAKLIIEKPVSHENLIEAVNIVLNK